MHPGEAEVPEGGVLSQGSKDDSKSTTSSAQPRIADVFLTTKASEKKQETITELITKMICIDTLPISFVENDGFRNLMRYTVPFYSTPSKRTISSRIDCLYDHEMKKLISELSDVTSLAVTTDCWSSRSCESYAAVTCHYIDEDWKRITKKLTTEPMEER